MISILHISTECYPAAKAGGMGDVVGSLPAYLPKHGVKASVIIPKYSNNWLSSAEYEQCYLGEITLGEESLKFEIQKIISEEYKFPLYCIDIPGKFDRSNIYLGSDGNAYPDEAERNIAFQVAILEWIVKSTQQFDGFHCHDHMTGLIPFFIKHTEAYKDLKDIPVFFTIHNGQYRGIWEWSKADLFPSFSENHRGLLDWDSQINCLATAIKCAWQINTVSPSYMEELKADLGNLTPLIQDEADKASGILNGIDHMVWDPASDKLLEYHLKNGDWSSFKSFHRQELCEGHGLDPSLPLISFIGRFAYEKGADLLSDAIEAFIESYEKVNFFILGSGDRKIENNIESLSKKYGKRVASVIAYDERLARTIYAGSDFLLMPSRFEPCGLNQMFCMRYGTIPIVRSIGGLKDTVPDYREGGNGVTFENAEIAEIVESFGIALRLYNQQKKFLKLRDKLVKLDFSWKQSAAAYSKMYFKFIKTTL